MANYRVSAATQSLFRRAGNFTAIEFQPYPALIIQPQTVCPRRAVMGKRQQAKRRFALQREDT
ncbi:hypothetical protein F2S73_16285 [Pseudomonas syringae pv. actinidiae]|nr:hypothetical protein [Pseudomonas syringae pv. actinidiae]